MGPICPNSADGSHPVDLVGFLLQVKRGLGDAEIAACFPDVADLLGVLDDSPLTLDFSLFGGHSSAPGFSWTRDCEKILALLLLSCSACVTFSDLPERLPQDGLPDARVSARMNIIIEELWLDGAGKSTPAPYEQYSPQRVLDALDRSGLFTAISTEATAYDIDATVRVQRAVYNRTGLLQLVTAYLVPGIEDRRILVATTLRDSRSGAEETGEASGEFRVWYELLLLPLAFSHASVRFEDNLLSGLVRKSVGEALATLGSEPAR